jgi:IS30 family transposase
MAQSDRGLTSAERSSLWSRWKAGETISEIGRSLGKPAGSVFSVLRARGGFAPAERTRATMCLSLADREEISRGLAGGLSLRSIGRQLGRPASTISREVTRNGGIETYRASAADAQTWQRAARPKLCALARRGRLRRMVARKLQRRWSPQQVSGWLKTTYPEDLQMQISHETIYKTLFIQARGALKQELLATLRSRRLMRRGRTATAKGQSRGQISDAVSIRERPAEAEDRAVPGHWEGDLISGKNNTHIATLVERHSRFVMLVKLAGKDSDSVVTALSRQVRRLPAQLKSSLTWDRGKEMAQHARFALATKVAVFFCDPHSPWQRGSNENTNGLLRQYFPKGTDLSVHSQTELNKVARELNMRPRQTLGFKTPAAMFRAAVAPTG